MANGNINRQILPDFEDNDWGFIITSGDGGQSIVCQAQRDIAHLETITTFPQLVIDVDSSATVGLDGGSFAAVAFRWMNSLASHPTQSRLFPDEDEFIANSHLSSSRQAVAWTGPLVHPDLFQVCLHIASDAIKS